MNQIVEYIGMLVPILIGLALIFFFVGVIRYIYTAGKPKFRNGMVWSLVALFVLVSVWGILRILQNSLLGGSGTQGGTQNAPQTQVLEV